MENVQLEKFVSAFRSVEDLYVFTSTSGDVYDLEV